MGASADGADITTFFAPPCKAKSIKGQLGVTVTSNVMQEIDSKQLTFLCNEAFSTVVKIPEDSTTYSTP